MTNSRYGVVLRQVGRLLGGGTVASLGAGQLLERFAADRDEAAFEALDIFSAGFSSGFLALDLKGPAVRRIAVFTVEGGKWYPQDLLEQTTDASPVVSLEQATYQLGRFLYVFSLKAKKWSVLELKRDPGNARFPGMSGEGNLIVPDDDLIHVYDAKRGEWTHIDTKDDQ